MKYNFIKTITVLIMLCLHRKYKITMEKIEKMEQIRQEILDEKLKEKPNVKYIRILQQMLDRIHKKYKSAK